MFRERSLLLALGMILASVVMVWAMRQGPADRDGDDEDWARHHPNDFASYTAQLDEAIRNNPTAENLYARGCIRIRTCEYGGAIDDFEEAIRIDPDHPWACNNLAWLKATCPDDQFRDAGDALAYATRACELTDWSNGVILDTLAAAAAEAGRFGEAVAWQRQAMEDGQFMRFHGRGAGERLELYESGAPYRLDGTE